MEPIYTHLIDSFEKNRPAVLATIIRQEGSAPRGVGTKCLILEGGQIIGTIGGGHLEAKVIGESGKVFETQLPLRLHFNLEGTDDLDELDMICGGEVELFLEPVSPENSNQLQLFNRIMEIERRGGSGIQVTIIDPQYWAPTQSLKAFIEPNGQKRGNLLDTGAIENQLRRSMDQILHRRQPLNLVCHDEEEKNIELFVEPVLSDPRLYVFGGGHVSLELAPLAHRVGFKVVVIDDRDEYADPKKFPDADDIIHNSFNGVVPRLSIDESSYLVIVTRGHKHDKIVLEQALKTPANYIGMIGSRRKIKMIYDKLIDEGFTDQDLECVHSPIGLDIGAETPQEIAVSIVAELIKIRAGKEA
jgi:xanthine dehydrogenase accessory factor